MFGSKALANSALNTAQSDKVDRVLFEVHGVQVRQSHYDKANEASRENIRRSLIRVDKLIREAQES
ncbi:MAG: hypothetical protein R3261_14785 [Alphaproteobacteria bacterium]|nr:hypothetical protein [Alphaproteobacteria bacterium]